jgi:hypothetical protein
MASRKWVRVVLTFASFVPSMMTILSHSFAFAARKRLSFLSAFPMFVPSLSWQNDHSV